MRTAFRAVGAAATLFLASARADSATTRVSDGDAFSVDVGFLHPCVIAPRSLRDDAACVGFTPDLATQPPDTSEKRSIMTAIVRFDDQTAGALGVHFITTRSEAPRSDADAAKLMRGGEEGFRKSIPSNAVVKARPPTFVRIAKGVGAVRASYDIEGLPQSQAILEHSALLVVPATTGTYFVTFSGAKAHAGDIESYLDRIVPTATVASPARGHDYGYEVGQLLGYFFFAIAVAVIAYVSHRRSQRQRREREQAWAQYYGQPPPR